MLDLDLSHERAERITAELLLSGRLPDPQAFAPLAARLLREAAALRAGLMTPEALARFEVALLSAAADPALRPWCEASGLREDVKALRAAATLPPALADYLEVWVAAHRVAHWQEDDDV